MHFVYYLLLIKITEDEKTPFSKVASTIHVVLENNDEKTFEGYPISLKSVDIKPLTYRLQKSVKTKDK
jgi:hypothetical protein